MLAHFFGLLGAGAMLDLLRVLRKPKNFAAFPVSRSRSGDKLEPGSRDQLACMEGLCAPGMWVVACRNDEL